MRRYPLRHRHAPWLACVLPLVLALPVSAAASPSASTSTWLDANGAPLRVDEDTILEMLRTAPVIAQKALTTGINRTLKLTLEQRGLRIHAAFRTVDVELPPPHRQSRPNRFTFRDSYRFEVAAYRLSRLLGLDRVPPTVLRKIGSDQGSVQLWIEDARSEADIRLASSGGPRSTGGHRQLQKQTMKVFDQLIYNFDRHLNNFLFDSEDRLWLIDHTRSFKKIPELSRLNQLVTCDREFFEHLRHTSDLEIKGQLGELLNAMELDAVLKRRRMLVKRFDLLIAERGEEYVLYDLDSTMGQPKVASSTLEGWAQRLKKRPPVRLSV